MDAFSISVNAVAPIFLMMVLGYLVKHVGIIDNNFVQKATKFVFRVSLPFMIYAKVASIDLASSLGLEQLNLLLFLVIAIVVSWLISDFVGKRTLKNPYNSRGNVQGSFVQGSFRCNFLIIGYPVLLSLYGDAIVVNLALSTLAVIPAFNVLSIISLSGNNHGSQKEKFKAVGKNILTNPLIISIVLGFIAAAVKLPKPDAIYTFIDMVGKTATPMGLLSIGAFFHFDQFKETFKIVIVSTILKLMILPIIFSLIAMLIGFSPMDVVFIAVLFGGPTAVSSFAMSNEMGGDSVLSGNIIILTSSLCVLSYVVILTGWLTYFG